MTEVRIGSVLDRRFRLDDELGEGGMGKVYRATQLSVGRQVAVKTIRADVTSPTVEQRFMQEAQLIASMNHPNLVQLVDYGFSDEAGVLYLAMEYVEGIPLANLVRKDALRLPLAIEVTRQICSGLAEAHSKGIVHRDLKPENVMLTITAEGAVQAKVLDFGIALAVAAETRMTATGAITGTPHYMSPEQAQDLTVTDSSDVYALGVMFYEMLCGSLPFRADTPMALLLKHVQAVPQPIGERVAGLPPQVAELVDQMLAKEPSGRPDSVRDIGLQLDSLKSQLGMSPVVLDVKKDREAAFSPYLTGQKTMSDGDMLGDTMDSPVAATPAPDSPTTDEMVFAETFDSVPDESPTEASQRVSVAEIETRSATPVRSPWPTAIAFVAVVFVIGAVVSVYLITQSLQAKQERALRFEGLGMADVVETKPAPPQPTVADVEDELPKPHAAKPKPKPVEEPPEVKEKEPIPKTPKKPEPKKAVKKPRPKNISEVPIDGAPPTDDVTLAMRKRALGGTCSSGETCVFEGTAKPGAVACLGDSKCEADCMIGGCKQMCLDKATCKFKCTGGNCTRYAAPTASMKELD